MIIGRLAERDRLVGVACGGLVGVAFITNSS